MRSFRCLAFYSVLFALCSSLRTLSPVYAAGEPSKCVITIKTVELKDANANWFPVIEPDKQVNLVEEETGVSFFNTQGRVPPGKYVNFRITLSETVRVSGKDGSYLTKAGGVVKIGGTAARASELPGEITSFIETSPTFSATQEGESTVLLNLDHEDIDGTMQLYGTEDFEKAFAVKQGSFISVWFDLDLSFTIRHAWPNAFGPGLPKGQAMYFLPPQKVTEATLTVDSQSASLGPDEITLAF